MSQLTVKSDGSLSVFYNNPDIPVSVKNGLLSALPENRMLAHWHEDLEFLQATEGSIATRINGNEIVLEAGDIIFLNSRQVHMNFGFGADCQYRLIQIHPRILSAGIKKGSSADALLKDVRFRCYVFKSRSREWQQINSILDTIENTMFEAARDYELLIVSYACMLYYYICSCYHPDTVVSTNTSENDLDIQRAMISFLYRHYNNKVSLDEIAESGHVSRSKCCRLFQQYVKQTPMDFLNDYRLEESCLLLKDTDDSIASIAQMCGFTDQSYFTRIFKRKFDYTPRDYRRLTR